MSNVHETVQPDSTEEVDAGQIAIIAAAGAATVVTTYFVARTLNRRYRWSSKWADAPARRAMKKSAKAAAKADAAHEDDTASDKKKDRKNSRANKKRDRFAKATLKTRDRNDKYQERLEAKLKRVLQEIDHLQGQGEDVDGGFDQMVNEATLQRFGSRAQKLRDKIATAESEISEIEDVLTAQVFEPVMEATSEMLDLDPEISEELKAQAESTFMEQAKMARSIKRELKRLQKEQPDADEDELVIQAYKNAGGDQLEEFTAMFKAATESELAEQFRPPSDPLPLRSEDGPASTATPEEILENESTNSQVKRTITRFVKQVGNGRTKAMSKLQLDVVRRMWATFEVARNEGEDAKAEHNYRVLSYIFEGPVHRVLVPVYCGEGTSRSFMKAHTSDVVFNDGEATSDGDLVVDDLTVYRYTQSTIKPVGYIIKSDRPLDTIEAALEAAGVKDATPEGRAARVHELVLEWRERATGTKPVPSAS